MKITVLAENTAGNPLLTAEHGLSLFIETKKHKILFDMGKTDAFAANARALGVDLSEVDIAVLSHGHYDHGGGMGEFLRVNSQAPIYVSVHAFEPHYHGEEKYIGIDTSLCGEPRIRFVEDTVEIDSELSIHTCKGYPLTEPIDSADLTVKRGNKFVDEDFIHEQYLLINEGGKRTLISGCSHRGIINISTRFSPDVLVGGFHFMKIDVNTDAERLERAAALLLRHPTVYYTAHCTGTEQYDFLKKRMRERLFYLSTGDIAEI